MIVRNPFAALAAMERPTIPLLAISAFGWGMLSLSATQPFIPEFCRSNAWQAVWRGLIGWEQFFALNSPKGMALGTIAMLLAMMPLLIVQPVGYLYQRSIKRRRNRMICGFFVAYALIWVAATIALSLVAMSLRMLFNENSMFSLLAGIAAIFIWQAAPARQRCLNRCHALPSLSAFAWKADRDALRYGLRHGGLCVGACWAWMLLPLLLAGTAHLAAMLAVTLLLAFERTRPARPAHWRWPLQEARLLPKLMLRPRRNMAATALASLKP